MARKVAKKNINKMKGPTKMNMTNMPSKGGGKIMMMKNINMKGGRK